MELKYKRILLKLSGETLLPEGESCGISIDSAAPIVSEIGKALESGAEIALVIGGGNILRGATLAADGKFDHARADTMGMLATAMNGLALQEAFARIGVRSSVMSSRRVEGLVAGFDRIEAIERLSAREVMIFVGGTGNPYFSTDSAAALRALEISAEAILKGTKVDGVYSADPKKDPSAVRFEKISFKDVIDRRLRVMDLTSMMLCMDHNLPVIVFDAFKDGNMLKVMSGHNLGTVIYGK